MEIKIENAEQFFDNILSLHVNTKGLVRIRENEIEKRTELDFEIKGIAYQVVKFTDEKPYYNYYVNVYQSGQWVRVPEEQLDDIFAALFTIATTGDEEIDYEAGVGFTENER